MTLSNPLVSVILPLYNAEFFIEEAVHTILNQTYTNFELIIIDDGSKDGSAEVVRKIEDPRIRFYTQENRGMANTLNTAIDKARGEFIARQDQDDLSYPQRLEKQVNYFKAHPNVGLLGTRARIFSSAQDTGRYHNHPAENAVLKFDLHFDNPFVHSSVMMRASALKKVGYYDVNKMPLVQDFELWSRFASCFEIGNLNEVLLDYREILSSMSRTETDFSKKVAEQSAEHINNTIHGDKTRIKDLAAVFHGVYSAYSGTSLVKEMENILIRLAEKIAADAPAEKMIVEKRLEQYIKIIRYNYHVFLQIQSKGKFFKHTYYRIINKIERKHANLNWE